MPRKLAPVLTALTISISSFHPALPQTKLFEDEGSAYLSSGLGVSRRMLRKELSEEGKEEGMKREGERDGGLCIHVQPKLAFYSHPL